MRIYFILCSLTILGSLSCTTRSTSGDFERYNIAQDENSSEQFADNNPPSELELALIDAGLVNVRKLNPAIMVDLKYASTDNFMEQNFYGDLRHCYLQPDVAMMLSKAQQYLKDLDPKLNLLVYDGARPRRVQYLFWNALNMPEEERAKYVADPEEGSIHNYGAAVDLTLANEEGKPLDMGTGYDFFGELAYPSKEKELLAKGDLSKEQIRNRQMLRGVMMRAGFKPIKTEWWHFNAISVEEAKGKYKIIE